MADSRRVDAWEEQGDASDEPGADQLVEADSSGSEADRGVGRMLLRVMVGSGEVALPAEEIVEVLTAAPIAYVPGAPAEVAGIVNRRGSMLTVIDLGEALGQDPAAADPEHRVVVVRFDGREVGIAVRDVLRLVGELEIGGVEAEGGGRRQPPLRIVELEPLLGPLFRSAE